MIEAQRRNRPSDAPNAIVDVILRREFLKDTEPGDLADLCADVFRARARGDIVEERRALIELAAVAANDAQDLPLPEVGDDEPPEER